MCQIRGLDWPISLAEGSSFHPGVNFMTDADIPP
jgi:hypothetical protein